VLDPRDLRGEGPLLTAGGDRCALRGDARCPATSTVCASTIPQPSRIFTPVAGKRVEVALSRSNRDHLAMEAPRASTRRSSSRSRARASSRLLT
jgi:hypothetical protein